MLAIAIVVLLVGPRIMDEAKKVGGRTIRETQLRERRIAADLDQRAGAIHHTQIRVQRISCGTRGCNFEG